MFDEKTLAEREGDRELFALIAEWRQTIKRGDDLYDEADRIRTMQPATVRGAIAVLEIVSEVGDDLNDRGLLAPALAGLREIVEREGIA